MNRPLWKQYMNHVYACINQNPCGSTKEYIARIPYLNYVSGGVVHPQKNPMKKVAEALNLTNKQIPLNIIFTGHSDQTPEPRDQYEEKRIHWL